MKTRKTLFLLAMFFVFFECLSIFFSEAVPSALSQTLLAAEDPQPPDSRVRVIVRFAKMRILANANAKVIKEIGFGTMLRVLGKSGDYFQVAALNAPDKPGSESWYVLQSEVEAVAADAVQALVDPRRVTFTSATPVVGEPMIFTASNFRTPNLLKWDMGDGTILTSGGGKTSPGQDATMAYAYAAAGQFEVKVYDDNGNMGSAPVRTQVTVAARSPVLLVAPERPLANHPVVITARDFRTPEKIAWDLGDGTVINPGPGPGVLKASFQVSHIYASPGTYTVKAFDDAGDKRLPPLTVKFVIADDPRQVRMEPAKAAVGMAMQFSASNFNTPDHLRWEMGDGTILPAEKETGVRIGSTVNYSYKKSGNYLVKVYDWDGDPGRQPVQFVVTVTLAPEVAAASVPLISPPLRNEATTISPAAAPAAKKYLLLKFGPYAGYFQPRSGLLKEIYGPGDVLYGGRLAVHLWQGLYLGLSASQYKVISQTTFTGDKTTLTLLPVNASLRYIFLLGFFNPYAGGGFTYLSFKEESTIGNVKGNGSNLSLEAGFELRLNRHFSLDFGARFEQIKIKPEAIDEEIDLGGLQAGITMVVSF